MRARTCAALAILVGSGLPTPNAYAADAITVEEYVELKEARDLSILVPYLQGAADAMWSANSALAGAGKPPLYCSSEDRPLSATRLMEITDRLLANLARQGRPAPPSLSITTVAANAVVLSYSCK